MYFYCIYICTYQYISVCTVMYSVYMTYSAGEALI